MGVSKKRIFIIHGWSGNPKEGWFPWLKKELTKKGLRVFVPAMPNPDYPKINPWINKLKSVVRNPDENTFFVCHSIGCQAVLRYVSGLDNKKIGGIIAVAGWFKLKGLTTREEKTIARPWLAKKINFKKIRSVVSKTVAIFSDNDPFVSLRGNSKVFREKLGAKILVERGKGHMGSDDKILKLTSVLKALSLM
jgi:hypothetical protein